MAEPPDSDIDIDVTSTDFEDYEDYAFAFADTLDEAEQKRPPIPSARPLDQETPVDPVLRREYFLDRAYPYSRRMPVMDYYRTKLPLQVELVKLQDWVRETRQRLVVVFEGRDAAGKGGTIRRFMEHLNPRGARVVALEKPTERERGQWYFQRYVRHLPTKGEIVLFDRSWYNRSGVERVMGFCTEEEHASFFAQAPIFEKLLVDDGITLMKLWFSVSRAEQQRRFKLRETDPLKQWKLSPMDIASMERWEEYTEAKEETFRHTHRPHAPWTLIKSDDKMRARTNAMRHVLHTLPYTDKDVTVARAPNPWIVASASEIYDIPSAS